MSLRKIPGVSATAASRRLVCGSAPNTKIVQPAKSVQTAGQGKNGASAEVFLSFFFGLMTNYKNR